MFLMKTFLKSQSWGLTSRSTARVILGQVENIFKMYKMTQETRFDWKRFQKFIK